ncbi:MAG: hypothetical protein KKB82_04560 [Candidatus Omnitrophica bacterium]|nr:hypothetical protein [Candidatus Omnitrophota bacterium]MBU1925175.1 hypothetical protein [Candidatus Omnitrophota bacterium]
MKRLSLLLLMLFIVCGCSPFVVKLATGGRGVVLPQVVANFEPVLKENKLFIVGSLVIENTSESDIKLDRIVLVFKDEKGKIIEKAALSWQKASIAYRDKLEAPLEIKLDLSVLNKDYISVSVQTGFTYKKFNTYIPVKNELAVIHLGFLKESINRTFCVTTYTKVYSNILGGVKMDYLLQIINPAAIDLLLEKGVIRIYTNEKGDITKTALPATVFKTNQENQIKGTLDLGNIFGTLIKLDFGKIHPLRLRFSGQLRVPDTDIRMPFQIELMQEVDFVLQHKK